MSRKVNAKQRKINIFQFSCQKFLTKQKSCDIIDLSEELYQFAFVRSMGLSYFYYYIISLGQMQVLNSSRLQKLCSFLQLKGVYLGLTEKFGNTERTKGVTKMTENITENITVTTTEQKSVPHMENISKAAELFNMTKYAVRVLAEEGKIKAVRIGGRIYVNVDSMRDFFLACTLSPADKPEPSEPCEKPSFAKPVKGIRRVG